MRVHDHGAQHVHRPVLGEPGPHQPDVRVDLLQPPGRHDPPADQQRPGGRVSQDDARISPARWRSASRQSVPDVTGSTILVLRFRFERRHPADSGTRERWAAVVVAAALAVAGVVLVDQSVTALVSGTRPATSGVTLIAASISFAVLAPLACAKRRLGKQMASRALLGDSTLSGIGATTSLLALAALVLYYLFGWWWADRIVALTIAIIAAAEARRTFPRRQPAG
ncbi:MAG TPA: cation transporter [Streptosporangiaceae bacterium]